jgi:hypothetical protein
VYLTSLCSEAEEHVNHAESEFEPEVLPLNAPTETLHHLYAYDPRTDAMDQYVARLRDPLVARQSQVGSNDWRASSWMCVEKVSSDGRSFTR